MGRHEKAVLHQAWIFLLQYFLAAAIIVHRFFNKPEKSVLAAFKDRLREFWKTEKVNI